jgi:Holliday junction resolvase RusA-like endonuclease
VKIEIKPLSLNQLYPSNRQGRRFLSKQGAQYKELIQQAVKLNSRYFPEKGYSLPLEFTYIVCGPFLTKSGTISKTAGDLDNFCKPLLDSVCQELEINDSCVFKITAEKRIANDWAIEFYLNPVLPIVH